MRTIAATFIWMVVAGCCVAQEVTDESILTHHDEIPRFAAKPDQTAVQSGNWSDPAVWGDSPPENDTTINRKDANAESERVLEADVAIPAGITVVYDLNSMSRFGSIEVAGVLKFDDQSPTRLYCDNIQILPHGKLIMGTEESPIDCEINICQKPIDRSIDPEQWGQGITCISGEWIMHGRPKTAAVRAAGEITAGQVQLRLADQVDGWKAGDVLYLPASDHWDDPQSVERGGQYGNIAPNPRWYPEPTTYKVPWVKGYRAGDIRWERNPDFRRDERIEIASVDGLIVNLKQPTRFNHPAAYRPDGSIVGVPWVLNTTRSIKFKSEDPTGTRGHIAMIGRSIIRHRYFETHEMGRTKIAWPIEIPYGGSAAMNKIGITTDNPAGRYSYHFHHMIGPENPRDDGDQYYVKGGVVYGDPKWGYVVHGTHFGTLEDCIGIDCFDAAFTTEDGYEVGNTFLACHSAGLCRRGFWLTGHRNRIINSVCHAVSAGMYLGASNGGHNLKAPTKRGQSLMEYEPFDYCSFAPKVDNFECYSSGEAIIWGNQSGNWKRTPDNKGQRNVATNILSWHNHRMSAVYGPASQEIAGFIHVGANHKLVGFNLDTCMTSNGSSTVDMTLRDGEIYNCDIGVRLRSRGDARSNNLITLIMQNESSIYPTPCTPTGFLNQVFVHLLKNGKLRGN
ncbi:MAG: G8 domain-containing protein, partial [Planctomycetales bacterium]|nr:G8 domain-containing protein [Planctomycetales bacterium]